MPGRLALVLILVLLAAVPASAQAFTLQAARAETGWIKLTATDAGDATRIAFAEQGTTLAEVTPSGGSAAVRHAAIWRCDRLERQFTATATYPDGTAQTATASIRTPSCASRFALAVRKLRGTIRAQVGDRWKVGGTSVRLCAEAPAAKTSCGELALPAGRTAARRNFRSRPGLWTISAGRVARDVYVHPAGKLRVLATGDSMVQIVDSYLKDRLKGASVRSDARISTGLSKPFLLDWPRHAAGQARKLRPDVTVVFIGANDGFSFGSIQCCGDAWVESYSKRVEAMMRSYSRQRRGLVYWLTLPAPQPAQWRPIYPAVNRAIKRAAARVGGAARVLDIARTFTPGYHFRRSMTWHGHRETVRQGDGVHLSTAGASIAETLVERALRRDGVL